MEESAAATKEPRRRREIDIRGYKHEPTMSLVQRAAHYLDWAARNYPKEYTPYPLLLKAIMGYARTPPLASKEVERLRKNMTAITRILLEKYGRQHDSQPGVGVRATSDEADLLVTVAPRKSRRLISARNALATTIGLIDVNKLPNTAALKPYRDWLQKDLRETMRLVGTDSFTQRLLPPASEPEKKK